MVILVYPMLSAKNYVNKDSNYVYLKVLINEMIRQRPDWYFIYPFPENEGWSYIEEPEFWDRKNIIRIGKYFPIAKKDNVVHYDMKFWKRIIKKYGIDIMWTQVTEIGQNLPFVAPTFDIKARPIVVNQHHYIIHKSMPYPVESQLNLLLNQLSSARVVDMNVFNSDYTRQLVEENAEEYWGDKFKMNYEIIKMGVLNEELFNRFDIKDKYDKFTIHYNHRLQDFKKWRTTFNILNELYKEGYDFNLVITGEGKQQVLKKYPFVIFKDNLISYDSYIEELSKGHLNTTNTTIETFCIAGIESMGAGEVLVAQNGLTFPELVSGDYPYLFNTQREQKEMIKGLMEWWNNDKEGYLDYVAGLKQEILSKWVLKEYAKNYIELFEGFDTKTIERLKPQNRQHIIRTLKENNYKFERLETVWRKLLYNHFGHQAFPKIKVKRILNDLGYSDYIDKDNKEQYIKYEGRGK